MNGRFRSVLIGTQHYSCIRSMGSGGYHVSGAGMLGVHILKDLDDLGKLEGVVAAYDKLTWVLHNSV